MKHVAVFGVLGASLVSAPMAAMPSDMPSDVTAAAAPVQRLPDDTLETSAPRPLRNEGMVMIDRIEVDRASGTVRMTVPCPNGPGVVTYQFATRTYCANDEDCRPSLAAAALAACDRL